ncbi:MAG TPA: alpha/beta hydrolase [bacterium]|nr:alpha/beta hydrolase [bacterium]
MVLVHGWTGSSYDWNKLMPILAARHRVIAYDQTGFGKSDKPLMPYRLETFTGLLGRLADALGLGPFHLVGNSMGGHIAAAFALQHPERVRSLALLDAAGVSEGAPWVFNAGRFPRALAALLRITPLPLYGYYYRRSGPYYDSSFLTARDVLGHYHSYGNRAGAYAAAQCMRHIIYEPAAQLDQRLKEMRVPTLIVWGHKDPLLGKHMSSVFLREIPGARRVFIENCGHCPQEEKPGELRDILEEFWKELPAKK